MVNGQGGTFALREAFEKDVLLTKKELILQILSRNRKKNIR